MPTQPKLNLTYPTITTTKAILKTNPEISEDQVKGYDRRVRGSPFIMEHVKIIERLTNDLVEKGMENYRLTEELDEWKTEIQPDFTELRSPSEISSMIDDMYENIKELKAELDIAKYYQSGVLERLAPLLPLDDSPQDIIGDICDIITGNQCETASGDIPSRFSGDS